MSRSGTCPAHVATGFSGIIPSFSFSCAIAGIAMQLRDSMPGRQTKAFQQRLEYTAGGCAVVGFNAGQFPALICRIFPVFSTA